MAGPGLLLHRLLRGNPLPEVGPVSDEIRAMFLSDDRFQTVVASTPLVSLDLVVRDNAGRVLLGRRLNRPAAGFWFVPGGRVRKGETLVAAFERLVREELGQSVSPNNAGYLGLYEHFYEDSAAGEGIGTHYVVNAFELTLPLTNLSLPELQHSEYHWWSVPDLHAAADVHEHTKWYFQPGRAFAEGRASEDRSLS